MTYLLQILLLPLLVLDCLANAVIGGSPRNTLSGEAWNHRNHPEWGWCQDFIDALFGLDHCMQAAAREKQFGSWWAAWLSDFTTATKETSK